MPVLRPKTNRQRSNGREQVRQPAVAELVAASLRSKIVSGELGEGDSLPRQDDMVETFGVSRPSLREALRILESEGLLTVQRGSIGGARVHAPHERGAGYMLGLVLRARHVPIVDVGEALNLLEPLCTGLCAAREDRKTNVLPRLRSLHDQMTEYLDDGLSFTNAARRFHEALVACCGNDTLIVVVGALESLWLGHQEAWALETAGTPAFPDREVRRSGLQAHARIISLIERGDVQRVTEVDRRHLETIARYTRRTAVPKPRARGSLGVVRKSVAADGRHRTSRLV